MMANLTWGTSYYQALLHKCLAHSLIPSTCLEPGLQILQLSTGQGRLPGCGAGSLPWVASAPPLKQRARSSRQRLHHPLLLKHLTKSVLVFHSYVDKYHDNEDASCEHQKRVAELPGSCLSSLFTLQQAFSLRLLSALHLISDTLAARLWKQ